MPDRLSTLDVSFLYLEEATTPMHVGSLAVFQVPEQGFDYDRLVALIRSRIGLVPRYRQRIRQVPGRLANPVWVDDENFDITYHVRRSALPKPGNDEQLRDLVARLVSRRLDRDRPLWEMYLVEGLADNRFAIVTKTHHAMVDGAAAVDIAQVILDVTPEPRSIPRDTWRPENEPSSAQLVAEAVGDFARSPTSALDVVQNGVSDVRSVLTKVIGAAFDVASALSVVARPAPSSPLNAEIGKARRYATAETSLADYKAIRAHHGGTVNDVVLATVAGALRSWLMMRGEVVRASTVVRVMVPVSVRSDGDRSATGNRVSSLFVDLPVGEASPVIRLQRISYAMQVHKDSGQAVGAEAIIELAGFAPPTLHALGARVASDLSRRLYNVIVTNVPGPQFPLYAHGALLLSAAPIVPLARGQAVSIGLTSYNGGVFYGLVADRDAMPDVDVLAEALVDSLAELRESITTSRGLVGKPAVAARTTAPLKAAQTRPATKPATKPLTKPAAKPATKPAVKPLIKATDTPAEAEPPEQEVS